MRYLVRVGSQSGHCCFNATVVDTANPQIIDGKHYRDHTTGMPRYEQICECFNLEDAERITDALNALPEPPK